MDPLIDDFRVETVIRCGLGRGGGMKETHTANDTAPARNPRLWTLVVAVGYIAAWIGLWFVSRQLNLTTGISLWYPPAGLTFAILLGCGGWGFAAAGAGFAARRFVHLVMGAVAILSGC